MDNQIETSQKITLINRKGLSITGVEKMLTVKSDLLQITTNLGTIQIYGSGMEVNRLDLDSKILEVNGLVSTIKYLDDKKLPFLKRIFK